MFDAKNIRRCEEYIISIQRKIDRAVAGNDKKSIRELFDLLTCRSQAVRTYATWKITRKNQGKYTAGIDGIALPRGESIEEQDLFRHKVMKDIDIHKKPDSIRRVYIPKPNGKKRPLGIPTIHDRIVQEVYRIALDPIVEYHFLHCSYGFRPKRSCHDAISVLFHRLARRIAKRYILECDIKGCFDNISHNHIIATLQAWHTPNWALDYIQKALKSKIFHNGEVYDNETGTPQGGVISPMLANVALTSLDALCNTFVKREVNPMVRYADDFVLVCKNEPEATHYKERIAEHLSEQVGLTLSEEKTKTTHIRKGFNFLAFNIKKYTKPNCDEEILLIKPQREKVINALRDWKQVIRDHHGSSAETLIQSLKPKMRGWAMYYRHTASKATYGKVDYEMWDKLYRWAKRKHNGKSNKWIMRKYFVRDGKRSILMYGKTTIDFLPNLSQIPIRRFTRVRKDKRVYDETLETTEYWAKREYTNAYGQIWSIKIKRLYNKQKGKCYHCKALINYDDITNSKVHIHHLIPKVVGGTDAYSNLRVVHELCHKDIHKSQKTTHS